MLMTTHNKTPISAIDVEVRDKPSTVSDDLWAGYLTDWTCLKHGRKAAIETLKRFDQQHMDGNATSCNCISWRQSVWMIHIKGSQEPTFLQARKLDNGTTIAAVPDLWTMAPFRAKHHNYLLFFDWLAASHYILISRSHPLFFLHLMDYRKCTDIMSTVSEMSIERVAMYMCHWMLSFNFDSNKVVMVNRKHEDWHGNGKRLEKIRYGVRDG